MFGGGFVLGFLEPGVADEDVALLAPDPRLVLSVTDRWGIVPYLLLTSRIRPWCMLPLRNGN